MDPADARPGRPPDIYIENTPGKGRGAFAARAFAAEEVVEFAPIILVLPHEIVECTELRRRAFQWQSKKIRNSMLQAIVFGYGSIYNHANPANMRWYTEEAGEWAIYQAIRDIAQGEELTINYNESAGHSTDNRWFEKHNVDLVE